MNYALYLCLIIEVICLYLLIKNLIKWSKEDFMHSNK
jgi:hypothetical protein